MTRHYHRQDLASYGDVMAGFQPIPEDEREAFRYTASRWQVDPMVCRSWAPISDVEHVVLLMDPETEELFLVTKSSPSDEQVVVVADTPLMLDERHVEETDAVAGVIIPATGVESLLPMDFRRKPIPVHMLTPSALKACADNGRRPFRVWEWETVRPCADYAEARAFFRALDDWKQTEQGQALTAGRGDAPTSTPAADKVRGFLRSL